MDFPQYTGILFSYMKKTYTSIVAALLVTAFTLHAGTPVLDSKTTSLPTLGGSFGVDIVSGYTFNGVQIEKGPTVQPYLNLNVPLDIQLGLIDSASLFVKARQFTTSNAPKGDWFRSEVATGIALNIGALSLTPTYHYINSPNGSADQAQAVSATLAYGGKLFGQLALNPHATVFYGTQGNAGNGKDNGVYYEVGVAPGFKIQGTDVTVPINVGVASNNFYANDQRYGYTSFGVATKTPLLTNVFLKTSATYFSTKEALNSGQTNHWQIGAGIGVDF